MCEGDLSLGQTSPTADKEGLWPETDSRQLCSVDQMKTPVSEHAPLASALTGSDG